MELYLEVHVGIYLLCTHVACSKGTVITCKMGVKLRRGPCFDVSETCLNFCHFLKTLDRFFGKSRLMSPSWSLERKNVSGEDTSVA